MPANHRRPITIRDKRFDSCAEACRWFGVRRDSAASRVQSAGQSWEDAIESLIIKKEQKVGNDKHNAGKLPLKPYTPWAKP